MRLIARAAAFAILLAAGPLGGSMAEAQPRPPESNRPTAPPPTPAQIRQQATQRATLLREWEALLADPDANVRLVSFREGVRHPDPAIRDLALNRSLASDETAIVEVGLRAIVAQARAVTLHLAPPENARPASQGSGQLHLPITSADADTGNATGTARNCAGASDWAGRVQGMTFSFATGNARCSGTLTWNAEAGQFQGRVNLGGGHPRGARDAVWQPR